MYRGALALHLHPELERSERAREDVPNISADLYLPIETDADVVVSSARIGETKAPARPKTDADDAIKKQATAFFYGKIFRCRSTYSTRDDRIQISGDSRTLATTFVLSAWQGALAGREAIDIHNSNRLIRNGARLVCATSLRSKTTRLKKNIADVGIAIAERTNSIGCFLIVFRSFR
jgi:hypothetical protein